MPPFSPQRNNSWQRWCHLCSLSTSAGKCSHCRRQLVRWIFSRHILIFKEWIHPPLNTKLHQIHLTKKLWLMPNKPSIFLMVTLAKTFAGQLQILVEFIVLYLVFILSLMWLSMYVPLLFWKTYYLDLSSNQSRDAVCQTSIESLLACLG